jgi:hypothetical protein
MDGWLTCSALAPWCLCWQEKLLLCFVQGIKPSILVGNAISGTETRRPGGEDAGGSSFTYCVMRKPSNPDVRRCTGEYGLDNKWARG